MQNDVTHDKNALAQRIDDELAALRQLQKVSEENAQLKDKNSQLNDENQALKNRITWFEKQIFGQKSEKRVIDNPHQASLLSEPTETEVGRSGGEHCALISFRGALAGPHGIECIVHQHEQRKSHTHNTAPTQCAHYILHDTP